MHTHTYVYLFRQLLLKTRLVVIHSAIPFRPNLVIPKATFPARYSSSTRASFHICYKIESPKTPTLGEYNQHTREIHTCFQEGLHTENVAKGGVNQNFQNVGGGAKVEACVVSMNGVSTFEKSRGEEQEELTYSSFMPSWHWSVIHKLHFTRIFKVVLCAFFITCYVYECAEATQNV